MRDPDPVGDLTEIEEAIERIERYVAGLDRAAFAASDKDQDAVAMNLIVIGESVRSLDPALLAQEPGVPWPAIIAVRNRIAHRYATIQRDFTGPSGRNRPPTRGRGLLRTTVRDERPA
jgi:uncharacterized protein with HEPN domain